MDDTNQPKLPPKTNNFKILSLVMVGVLAVMMAASYSASQRKNVTSSKAATLPTAIISQPQDVSLDQVLGAFGKFLPQDQVVATVNGQSITNKDLNYYLFTKRRSEYFSEKNLTKLKQSVLQDVLDNTVVLLSKKPQTSRKPVAQITSTDLNTESQQVEASKNDALQNSTEKISGAMISIWYHNISLPKNMTVQQARSVAMSKLQALQTDLVNKKITAQQAGNTIKNDASLAEIDASYKINAYVPFDNKSPDDMIFNFEELNNAIKTMQPGDISPVIDHPANPALKDATHEEEFLAVLVVSKHSKPGAGGYNQWIKKQRANYQIVIPTP